MVPARKSSRVCALAVGVMETSPPRRSVFSPWAASQVRSATSWVPPSCGVASVFPRSAAASVIPARTTSWAPPAAAPATTRSPRPPLAVNAAIAGFGPR